MRAARWMAMALVAGALVGSVRAQEPDGADASALERGPLLVWWVTRATARDRAVIEGRKLAATAGPPTKSVEKTMGEFGETSSSVGQTAASYGQTASSLGTAASDTGKNAGSVGETAGSFGRTSSSVGQTAGSYGQTASSLGQDASSYGESIAQASVPVPLPGQMTRTSVVNVAQRRLGDLLRGSYPGVQAQFIDVLDVELRERLDRAKGTREYPDVVVGAEGLPWWKNSGFGLTMLGVPDALVRPVVGSLGPQFDARFATILRAAPHMAQAKAFVVWVRDERSCGICKYEPLDGVPADALRVAKGAVVSVLGGGGMGADADPEAAKFDAGRAQWMALGSSGGTAEGGLEPLQVETKVTFAAAQGPLAVVALRGVESGDTSFGVTHSVVVLRKSEAGAWRVLQVSANMWPAGEEGSQWALVRGMRGAVGDSKVEGVSVASPVDGDNRQAAPELWWDNKGGAKLEVVEWQIVNSSTNLQMVPDVDSRLKTRVVAEFARLPLAYKWRVWAVGPGGQLVLSDWRTFSVVGR